MTNVWVVQLIVTLFFSCALTCLGRLVSTSLGHWELCGYSYGYCSIMMVQPQHRMRFLFLYQRWVSPVLISANISLKFQKLWQRLTLYSIRFEVSIYSVFSVFIFHKLSCLHFMDCAVKCYFHLTYSVSNVLWSMHMLWSSLHLDHLQYLGMFIFTSMKCL